MASVGGGEWERAEERRSKRPTWGPDQARPCKPCKSLDLVLSAIGSQRRASRRGLTRPSSYLREGLVLLSGRS